MVPAAQSFFAAFCGWLVPFVGTLAVMQFGPGFGRITDFGFTAFWPLAVTAFGWLVVGVPVARALARVEDLTLARSILTWTVATTASFLPVVLLSSFELLGLTWWPATTGVVGGAVFWTLRRRRFEVRTVLFGTPVLLPLFVWFVVVPLGVRHAPYTTLVLLDGAIGPQAELNVISTIEVGDTFDELQQRYPALFEMPMGGKDAGLRGGAGYRLRFDGVGGTVTEVQVWGRKGDPSEHVPPPWAQFGASGTR